MCVYVLMLEGRQLLFIFSLTRAKSLYKIAVSQCSPNNLDVC